MERILRMSFALALVATTQAKPTTPTMDSFQSVLTTVSLDSDVTDRESWMTDEVYYNDIDIEDRPQGDQPEEQRMELCPPVPVVLPHGFCQASACSSDSDCAGTGSDNRKCCYNGCVYTCLPELIPAPIVDWVREPRRKLRSGLSWLVVGPDQPYEEDSCTTTPVDSDPFLCPEGYYCHIYYDGDPKNGIPNVGTCTKENAAENKTDNAVRKTADDFTNGENSDDVRVDYGDVVSERMEHLVQGEKHPHACDVMEGQMLLEGHTMLLGGQLCLCQNKKLVCKDED